MGMKRVDIIKGSLIDRLRTLHTIAADITVDNVIGLNYDWYRKSRQGTVAFVEVMGTNLMSRYVKPIESKDEAKSVLVECAEAIRAYFLEKTCVFNQDIKLYYLGEEFNP